LRSGTYTFDIDVKISSGKLTFEGGADDVFIIRTSSNFIQAAGTEVVFSGGALAKNIFWQVAGLVKVKAGAHCWKAFSWSRLLLYSLLVHP
jgi:hypothetical protein